MARHSRFGGGFNSRSPRRGRRSSSRKGQIRGGKVVQYSNQTPNGETTYIGTTNNPRRRAAEHRRSGKLRKGDKLVVETRAMPRKSAERVETAKLASHRRRNGLNPKHNVTGDGRYHSSK